MQKLVAALKYAAVGAAAAPAPHMAELLAGVNPAVASLAASLVAVVAAALKPPHQEGK